MISDFTFNVKVYLSSYIYLILSDEVFVSVW